MERDELLKAIDKLPGGPWYTFAEFDDDEDTFYSVCSQEGPCDEDCPEVPHCHSCVVFEGVPKEYAEGLVAMRQLLDQLL